MDFSLLPAAALMTFEITVVAAAIGIVLGVPVVTALRCPLRPVRAVTALVVDIVRGVPPLVWLMLVFLGTGVFTPSGTAMIVLGLVAAAYCAEIYRSGLESIPRGQSEALGALAVPTAVGYARVIVPQAAVVSAPAVITYVIGLIKDTSLASVIGVAELTFVANHAANRTGDGIGPFVTVGVIYLLLSVCLGLAGRLATRRAEGTWVHRS